MLTLKQNDGAFQGLPKPPPLKVCDAAEGLDRLGPRLEIELGVAAGATAPI